MAALSISPKPPFLRAGLCSIAVKAMTRANLTYTHSPENISQGPSRWSKIFDLHDKVFAVTGGARGLGLTMAEALMGAGAEVYCLDRLAEPELEFWNAQRYSKQGVNGSLHYRRVDVRDAAAMDETFSAITKIKNRLDGVIAAAGVNHVANAIDHAPADIEKIMSINYTGTFVTATAAAKQMMQTRTPGSIVLVASISGLITNKGMVSPVYNSSKAAVIQLTRSLAMEWGTTRSGDKLPIRVNCLCPGHTITAMAQMVMARSPGTQVLWESENMLGRLAEPQEFGGAAIFLLSETSTFMTGSTLVIDGGHTAW